jgi:mRNA interferase HigB
MKFVYNTILFPSKFSFFIICKTNNFPFWEVVCFLYVCFMRIIAFRTLREFWEKPEFADSEVSLRAWYHDVKNANWKNTNELKEQYKSASIIGDGRVVFNIKGNTYRLVVAIDFDFQIAFVRFIGTHSQYDKIDVKTI